MTTSELSKLLQIYDGITDLIESLFDTDDPLVIQALNERGRYEERVKVLLTRVKGEE